MDTERTSAREEQTAPAPRKTSLREWVEFTLNVVDSKPDHKPNSGAVCILCGSTEDLRKIDGLKAMICSKRHGPEPGSASGDAETS